MSGIDLIKCCLNMFNYISRPKHCWICFGTEDDDFDDNEEWVSPCRCRGTAQLVIYFIGV